MACYCKTDVFTHDEKRGKSDRCEGETLLYPQSVLESPEEEQVSVDGRHEADSTEEMKLKMSCVGTEVQEDQSNPADTEEKRQNSVKRRVTLRDNDLKTDGSG